MDKQVKKFLAFAIIDLLKHNVSLELKNADAILLHEGDVDVRVNGCFDEEHNILSCATGKAQHIWVPIFVHEYCHFKQWTSGCKLYKLSVEKDLDTKYEQWLSNKLELSQRALNFCLGTLRDLELDCEKRTVKMIEKYNLPIDKKTYIKMANAYVLYYNVLKTRREWYTVAPYSVKEIIDIMPDHFLNDYSRTPKKFRELVNKYCFK